jgi:glycosyltransferase involved in cell wall biosynthesis
MLRWAVEAGHEVSALTTDQFEGTHTLTLDDLLQTGGFEVRKTDGRPADHQGRPAVRATWQFMHEGVTCVVVASLTPRGKDPLPVDVTEYVGHAGRILAELKPDLMITPGGHRALHVAMARARHSGTKVLYSLRNFGHEARFRFEHADRVCTVSRFMAEHYAPFVGHLPDVLFPPVDWSEALIPADSPRDAAVFVNPVPRKGSSLVAAMAVKLSAIRPDMRMAVVASQTSGSEFLREAGGGVEIIKTCDQPREYLRRAKVLLAPSVYEPFGRVAVEAMLNGIPVIGADCGGLPEAMAGTGICLPLPEAILKSHRLSTAVHLDDADVEPWLRALISLWDEPASREELGRNAGRVAKEKFSPDAARCAHLKYFELAYGISPSN